MISLGLGLLMSADGCGDSGRESGDAGDSQGWVTNTPTTLTTASAGTVATQGDSEAGTASQGMTMTPTTTMSAPTEGQSTDAIKFDLGTVDVGVDPCDGNGGTVDFSYLWVANTDQGSISKVNTETLVEEARYYSEASQAGGASPSRTSVNIDGHHVVVSNRGTGWVTKVAASSADCPDSNGNGVIDTSQDKDDLRPWGSDECVLWSTQVNAPFSPGSGPRATAWGPGEYNPQTCKYENQKVWIGWLKGPGQAVMGRLDGQTGALEAQVDLPGWPLTVDAANGYAPYGAAIDPQGYVWTTPVDSRLAYRIDPVTLEVKAWTSPNNDSHYGMTIDGKGRVWFANWQGHGGVSMFDPMTESWALVPGSEGNVLRGIAADPNGNVWIAANYGGVNGCGLLQVSGDTLTVVTFHTFPMCNIPVGVSIDFEDKVWMVDFDGWTYKIDPVTYEKTLVPIANQHYTYSDMTGAGLVNAIAPG
ncbi:lyase [Nannocystis radixulma]|uniref:Lyase n=1 Tax=Nannocystis radixulma TaxID=2995305 RepID=A0ABT5BG69_9BACT|nr:lyase [Nannocystis radixulma]MDC0672610.1 lyase [Nannocystis radixulma]